MTPSIRAQLHAAWEESGIPMGDLAAKVGIDRGNLHRKLHKDNHGFDVKQAQRVAAALGYTIVWAPPRRAKRKARSSRAAMAGARA